MRTLRSLILVSFLVLLLSPVASHAETDENSMLEQARQQFSSGNYYFATTWLERLLKNYPATPHRKEILVMMAKSYDATERDEKAAEAVRTLMKDYPDAAATLDSRLLKLAGYNPPPGSASSGTAVPPAHIEPDAKTAAMQKVPKPAEPSQVPSSPPVPLTPPAQTGSSVKTAASPPVIEPAAPAVTGPVPQINLSLMSALEMAISRNIDLRVEALNSSMSEIDAARSRGIYDPLLNASVTGGESVTTGTPLYKLKNMTATLGLTQYIPTGGSIAASHQTSYSNADAQFVQASTGTTTPDTNDWLSSLGLTLTQPLLKNAGRETMELNITLAANTLQDSLERFRSTTTDTVSAVIIAYNHLYALREVLETRVAGLNSAQTLLDGIRKKENPGSLQGMEVANAEFAMTQRRKDLVDAERNVRDQESTLRYLIGMEAKAHVIPSDSPSQREPEGTEEQSVKAALAIRPDLKQLYLSLKSGQLQERVARHQALPDLLFTASGGIIGNGTTDGASYQQLVRKPSNFWSAGLTLNVPLGNTAAANDYLKSKIRTEQLQDQIKALEWKIRNDVEADLRALISARLQRQTAEQALQFAEKRLDEYRKNNLLGTATVQDVINAENDLTSARNVAMDATEAFANAVTKLWRDTGELLDRQNIHIDNHPGKPAEKKMPAASTVTVPSAPAP